VRAINKIPLIFKYFEPEFGIFIEIRQLKTSERNNKKINLDSILIASLYEGALVGAEETSKVAGKFNFPTKIFAISLIF